MANQNITNLIRQIAPRYNADPRLLIAVAKVESGLNPGAVGDGGTSFGLFQNHVGGAGGPTLESARRYLDPVASITNAAQRFAGLRSPVDAYNAQRPADRAGYIAKVSQALQGVNPALNAPITSSDVGAVGAAGMGSAGADPRKMLAMNMIFRDKPVMRSMFSLMNQPGAATSGGGDALDAAPAPYVGGDMGPIRSWKDLQRIATTKFGLQNDPGNSQTTGGSHTAGSEHYDGRAIDFGNARNSQSQLNAWMAWARRNGLDVLNEGDHAHVSLPGSGI